MPEFLKNKKYAQIFAYAVLTVICGVTFYLIVSDFSRVGGWLDKLFTVLSPLIYGCVIAYIMLPFMRLCEKKILRFKEGSKAEKKLKRPLAVLMTMLLFVLIKERLTAKTKKLLSAVMNRRHYVNLINLVRFTDKTFGGFVVGKIIDSIIIGLLTFIVMSIIGMPFTPLISVIVGITNIIPFFGPFIGAIPSAFIIFIAEPKMTIWFVLMILVIQQIDGNIIGPKILGSSTGLTSLAVLIAIMIGGGFFGVAGMILGVPAAAVICALVKQKTDERLKRKDAPVSLDYYYSDPPVIDFDKEPIFAPKENLPDKPTQTDDGDKIQ